MRDDETLPSMPRAQETNVPFRRLMNVLSQYVGSGSALASLNRALASLGLTPESLGPDETAELVSLVMADLEATLDQVTYRDLVLDLSSVASVGLAASLRARPRSDVQSRPDVTLDTRLGEASKSPGSLSSPRRR